MCKRSCVAAAGRRKGNDDFGRAVLSALQGVWCFGGGRSPVRDVLWAPQHAVSVVALENGWERMPGQTWWQWNSSRTWEHHQDCLHLGCGNMARSLLARVASLLRTRPPAAGTVALEAVELPRFRTVEEERADSVPSGKRRRKKPRRWAEKERTFGRVAVGVR
eukprot:TRINITY_DN25189_c0_g1_i18.p3 TRINITY_DN25189_c0_g1~~TRINITY_DN25189_c0_g1_i18.p3  ORF type:complete len:163 (+),score=31.04 TRINITY_DN25189_c0_g1_i18:1237-1725(+)